METSDNDLRKNDRRTPIIDGDARPDINLNPEQKEENTDHPIPIPGKGESKKKEKGITTQNRNDSNSLENFRDAKQE